MMKNKNILVGVVIVAVIAGGVFYLKSQQEQLVPNQAAVSSRLKGPSDAAVKIVEYSDFQCPSCKRAQSYLKEFLEKYEGEVSLEFKHFPLQGHLWATVAHQAAECAAEQGKFWEYHDKLFETQAKWSGPSSPVETFMKYAQEFDLKLEPFAACMSDEAVKKRVMDLKATGVALQVKSTPTIFVNDERVVGPTQIRQKGEGVIREALGLPPLEPVKKT